MENINQSDLLPGLNIVIGPNGSGKSAFLNSLEPGGFSGWDSIRLGDEDFYKNIISSFKRFNICSNVGFISIDNLTVKINVKKGDKWMPIRQLSTGERNIFWIIAKVAIVNNRPIAIDYPENGLHPDTLHSLMNFLFEESQEKQIVITTHSPAVLNIVSLDMNLDRILVSRITENGPILRRLNQKEQERALNYINDSGNIGDLWINSGLTID